MKKGSHSVFVDAISKDLHINAVHVNVSQEYIMITEDKTYRCLMEWQRNVRHRESWIAPVSLLASLTLTFVTATFRDALGVTKDAWQAVFIIGIACSGIWTIKALYTVLTAKGTSSVDDLIDKLKKGAVIQRGEVDSYRAEATERISPLTPPR